MLNQKLTQRLTQKLSPQQIQLMNLIELPADAIEQRINKELEENITLEKTEESHEEIKIENEKEIDLNDYASEDEIPGYYLQKMNGSKSKYEPQIAQESSFQQLLINQLSVFDLDDKESNVAKFIIGSLDDNGYLNYSVDEIADDLAFKFNVYVDKKYIENILKKVIHNLEPHGIGAQNLRECLLIQLKHRTASIEKDLCIKLIENHYNWFVKKHFQKFIDKFQITNKTYHKCLKLIENLNPKPGYSISSNQKNNNSITPDFTIEINNGNPQLRVNQDSIPQLYISDKYQDLIKTYLRTQKKSKPQKETIQFIKQKLDAAKWFIDAIEQRSKTLYKTMKTILDIQRDYFISFDKKDLKPIVLKDIADITGYDTSTISRVVNSKYVDTPSGIKSLKSFFSGGIKTNTGKEISNKQLEVLLLQIINEEDKTKPLTDEELATSLEEKGLIIARRTVAKYREALNIPVARLRRKWG